MGPFRYNFCIILHVKQHRVFVTGSTKKYLIGLDLEEMSQQNQNITLSVNVQSEH